MATVRLDGFRNYERLEVELDGKFNVLQGANAQGKTNFLEALHLVATTRLLRGLKDSEAILEGANKAICRVVLEPSHSELAVVLERGVRKRAMVNGMGLPRPADLLGRLPCVCSSLADMPIVAGEPSERRMFLDLDLSSHSTAYLQSLSHFKRALEQRNSLLRAAQEREIPDEVFEPWEEQMARHGAVLRAYRARYVGELAPEAQTVHADLGGGEHLGLSYAAKDEAGDEPSLRSLLAANRRADIARGSTTCGPQRDDLRVEIGGRDARLYGSQGQQRTAVLALKMATLSLWKVRLGCAPLLLLDDILADLDAGRRERLIGWVLERAEQAVLTCTEFESVGAEVRDRAKLFTVQNGEVSPA